MLTRVAFFSCFVLFLALSVVSVVHAQQTEPSEIDAECTIDLTLPGQMWDVLSNALCREFGKEESEAKEFWNNARGKFKTGDEVAIAAAKSFNLEEDALWAAIEKYRHANCTHAGGGNALNIDGDGTISDFAQNVLIHVVLHELGHGLVREFGLPTLGNEETLADAFATHYAVTKLPDEALQILEARIASLMIEANEIPREQWTVKGEHNSDARRAYQIAAVAIAHDASKYSTLAALVDMDDSDVRKAVDYGSEIHRSWRRTLMPLWMPDGEQSREARVILQDDSIFGGAISSNGLDQRFSAIVRSFDWHSQVTVAFAGGEGGAGWSRSSRTIRVHDEYIDRFNRQGKLRSQPQSK